MAEYNDELLELNEELNRIREEKIQGLGGLGSIEKMKSLTEEFVDAWLQAYKETGDGLTALDEKFDEFLENTLKKQLIMRGANNILQGLYDEYDKMFAEQSLGGEEVTREELEQINKLWREKQQVLDNFLQGMTTALGVASGSGSLSGLEEGIAGASEETVQVVAAYLNSIRFFVAENNAVLKQLRDYQMGTEDEVNPMLAQLRIIARQTGAIHTLLDSVTRAGHPQGGSGIRVFMD